MARKRKAGDGTVRQRKDGRWEGRIVIGYDDNGYPKTKNVLAKTKKECVEKLQKLKEDYGGLKPEKVRSEMPFGDWLTYWYENHSKPKIRPTTQETYESRIRLHIIPEIGDIPLNKLTQNDLQQFYGRLKKSGRKRFTDKYGEGLSDRMVRMCHATCPFRADTREQREKNLRTARAYMFYANKKMNMNAAAPHAYMPLLLCDEIPAERAIALRFGLEILEQSDVMLVCGNRLSNGMRGEIVKAALLRMPITVFDEGLYLEVQKLVTQNNGDKKSVKLDRENFPMAFTEPESYLENAALFK